MASNTSNSVLNTKPLLLDPINNRFPDDIVIKIIGKKIQEFENEKKNWIIEGFPRTKI